MDDRPTVLGIQVGVGSDAEAEEVAEATVRLRRELLELDDVAAEPPAVGAAPPGTKAVELAAIGALVVTVAQSQLLRGVLSAIRGWLAGQQRRSIRLELDGDVLELTGASSAEQQRLIDAWLRRQESR